VNVSSRHQPGSPYSSRPAILIGSIACTPKIAVSFGPPDRAEQMSSVVPSADRLGLLVGQTNNTARCRRPVLPRREWARLGRSACGSRTIHPKLRDDRPSTCACSRSSLYASFSRSDPMVVVLAQAVRPLPGRCRSRYGAVDAGPASAVSAATSPVANP
jgi:hypothetical protein